MSTPRSEKGENFMRKFRNRTNSDFSNITASELIAIWDHYDSDGNGFLENEELDLFLREFVSSACNSDVGTEVVSETMLREMKQDLLDAYDENEDGRIELSELAELLPTDENFLLIFTLENRLSSSIDFMATWKKYDSDQSGFIDGEELKHFLRDLLARAKPDAVISDEKLNEYSMAILRIFDDNNDGKLQLSEMARLLPLKEDILSKTLGRSLLQGTKHLSYHEIEKIFAVYDQDANGSIEKEELNGFVKDLMSLMKPNYTMEDVQQLKNVLLQSCDLNGDGKISKDELTVILLGLQKFRV